MGFAGGLAHRGVQAVMAVLSFAYFARGRTP
jgi:hypothetical protein